MPSTTSTPPPPATAEALSDLVAQVSFDEHYPSVDEVEGEQRHHQHQHSMEGGQQQDIALRAVVTTKEAGVIIGKEGRTVSGVREVTGVKVGVSKVIPRIHERTLTVSGPLPNVAKVCLNAAIPSSDDLELMKSTGLCPSRGASHRSLPIHSCQ